MRDENAFNAFLSKKFRALPGTASLKVAERHHIGISDFLLWRGGRGAGVEVKLSADFTAKSAVLKHPFSGPQQTWLATLTRTSTLAFGLVGVGASRLMYLIPADMIPERGTWNGADFMRLVSNSRVHEFAFDDIGRLTDTIFEHRVEAGVCLK